jgi:deazaflavin-dependent oxidoreductase (nitroreductase family)
LTRTLFSIIVGTIAQVKDKPMTDQPVSTHYQRPDVFTKHVFNRFTAAMTRMGISVWGSRVLEVKGRRSGQPRHTPVNLLDLDGRQYLVAPRGETDWVRNARADQGRIVLILGRRRRPYVLRELRGDDRVPVLRSYLRRWNWEVGMFFAGVGPDSTDAELAGAADRHPVFELTTIPSPS